MKGAECMAHECALDASPQVDATELEIILGLAKNAGCLDLHAVAERLAGVLQDDDDIEDQDSDYEDHSDEVLSGYTGCMHEALRFLIEEEGLSPSHPIVLGLANHLLIQQQMLEHSLQEQQHRSSA